MGNNLTMKTGWYHVKVLAGWVVVEIKVVFVRTFL
jgi:hypothetical protein